MKLPFLLFENVHSNEGRKNNIHMHLFNFPDIEEQNANNRNSNFSFLNKSK